MYFYLNALITMCVSKKDLYIGNVVN